MLATMFALFVLCASPGVLAGPPPVCVLRTFMLASSSLQFVSGVCPYCHGNAASCQWGTGGACPTQTVLESNRDFMAGKNQAGLSLQWVDPEYSGVFRSENLNSIVELVNRPVPGTAFDLRPDTLLSKILTAIRTGWTTGSLALEQLAAHAEATPDTESGKATKALIMERMKMLASMKDVLNAAPGRVITSVYDTGVYRWMHAKFSV